MILPLLAFLLPATAAAPLPAPQLASIDTRGSDTTDFALPPGAIHAPVTALRLRFDQPVLAGIADFRLLRDGPDAQWQTLACGIPAFGDEIDIALSALEYDANTNEVVLETPSPRGLAAGRYRMIVCDSITGALGALLDGDGDGLPGGVAIRDFEIEATPQLDNPGFTSGIEAWSVANLSLGTLTGSWSTLDADGDPRSGSLRLTGSGGAAARLSNDACALVAHTTWPTTLPVSIRLRYRVLVGDVRLILIASSGFGGDLGEAACIGPGIWEERIVEAGTASEEFSTHDTGVIELPAMPLAQFSLRVVSRTSGFDVLLDDIGFTFDPDVVFRSNFE